MSKTAEQEKGEPEGFVPALRYKWATGVYDLVIEYFTRGSVLRRLSVDAIAPEPGEAILDLGCGTGELSLAIAQTEPRSSVTGYDIDPEVLEIALNKMGLQGEVSAVTFRDVNVTDAASLPQQDIGRFDCVTSSLVFHHLNHDQKQQALKSVQALLRPGGRFVLIDWGPGANVFLRAAFWLVRLLDGLDVTRDNAQGKIPNMLEETSFSQIYAKPLLNTMFGTIWQYSANRCN